MEKFKVLYKIMKALIFILALGIVSCSSPKSTNKDFNSFYEEHESDEGVISIGIPMFLAKMFIDNDVDEQTQEVIDKLDKIKLFVCEESNINYAKIINDYLPESIYSDLLEINENNEKISFKIRKPEEEKITEVILTVVSSNSFVAVAFNGSFTLEDAKKFAKAVKTNEIKNVY